MAPTDPRKTPRLPRHRWAIGFLAAILGVWAVAMVLLLRQADLPDEASGTVFVVFESGSSDIERLTLLARADGVVIGQTSLPNIWVVHSEESGFAGRLRRAGASAVFREIDMSNVSVNGCFGTAPDFRTAIGRERK